ncbi:MAG: hypothetical protein KUG73_11250, partial [Pseudomonadales bacterium]|nr:hypothetical protein [Pseudomonadales bacterium]
HSLVSALQTLTTTIFNSPTTYTLAMCGLMVLNNGCDPEPTTTELVTAPGPADSATGAPTSPVGEFKLTLAGLDNLGLTAQIAAGSELRPAVGGRHGVMVFGDATINITSKKPMIRFTLCPLR